MSSPAQPRFHHLAITVTDLDTSIQWYESVFDVHPILDVPHPGGVGRILAGTDGELMFALTDTTPTTVASSPKPRPGSTTAASPSRPAVTWNCGRSTLKPTAWCAPTQPTSR